MAFSTDDNDDFQSLVASLNPENSTLAEEYLLNRNVCKLPWVEIAEEEDNPVYFVMVIGTFHWISLLFDAFLVGIILAHEDLRKQVNLKRPGVQCLRASFSIVCTCLQLSSKHATCN